MPRSFASRCFLAALLWTVLGVCAQAQWLVYELSFHTEEESVNFSHYSGAYLIAPVQGGQASLVFTTEEGGQFYAVSESCGRLFMAANRKAKKAAFTARAETGSAQAFYSASGYLNRTLLLDGPAGARSWRVAEKIQGRLLAADDESAQGPSADGSLGMSGFALIHGTLREDLSANATLSYPSLSLATRYIVELLEKYGYSDDVGVVPAAETEALEEEEGEGVIDPSLFPSGTAAPQP